MSATKADTIRQAVTNLNNLPTLAAISATVSELFQNPGTSAAEAGEIISHDQVLAAKTLRLANSAYFGFPSQIANVTQAVVLLGFNRVCELALTANIARSFKSGKDSQSKLDLKLLWEHSIVTAIAADVLSQQMAPHLERDAFSTGLLHDIGLLILAVCVPKDFEAVLELAAAKGCSVRDAELELLGIDHGAVGSLLCERWRFPKPLCQAVLYHHTPMVVAGSQELPALACMADMFAQATLIGTGADIRISSIDPRVPSVLHLERAPLEPILEKLFVGIRDARPFFEMLE